MKRSGLMLFLVTLGVFVLALGTPAEATTVGLWLFDEGEGDYAYDSSGNGNTGTLVNEPSWSDDTPFVYAGNHSLSFDGVDDYVNTTSNIGISGAASRTVAAWVKGTGIGFIVSWGEEATLKAWGCEVSGNSKMRLRGYITNIEADTVIPAGEWHHLAWVYDGTDILMYLDGSLDKQQAVAYNTTNSVVDIGRGNWGANHFNGTIDELAIFDEALTESQIRGLYEASFIPEPTTMLLLGGGLLGLAALGRRRKRLVG